VYDEDLCEPQSLQHNIRAIRSRGIRWAGYVQYFSWKFEANRVLRNLSVVSRIIIIYVLVCYQSIHTTTNNLTYSHVYSLFTSTSFDRI
jgi:hypothetical protein